MPEKCKIMRAVAAGLNCIKVEKPWQVTEPVVKTKLCEIGRVKFGCRVCAKSVKNADYGEWLYDVTWLEYEDDCDNTLIGAHLAAECEWGDCDHIYDDFQKLLLARASVRLMIFNGKDKCGSEKRAAWLAEKVGKYKVSCDEDAWLLAVWERNDNEKRGWWFRFFTIEKDASVRHPGADDHLFRAIEHRDWGDHADAT